MPRLKYTTEFTPRPSHKPLNALQETLLPALVLFILAAFLTTQVGAAPSIIPKAPKLNTRSHILIDYNSGHVIAERNATDRMEPASITKVMSSYVIASELKKGTISLNETVKISEKAWRMQGSRMFVEVNSRVKVEDLLKGVIVQSGNDATLALAQHVAGTEEAFVSMMNQHAERLGLTGTHFMNSTGLPDPDHYSTAQDLAKLGLAMIRDFPEHYQWYSIREYTYNNIKQKNRNDLLSRDESVDGIKTGHTESAGYCLVASAKRGDMRLISVVLGTDSQKARADESQKLLTYGFRFFETHKLYTANEPLTSVRVWKGEVEKLELGLNNDLYITIPRGQYKNLDANMNINAQVIAPVLGGQILGSVNVQLGSKNYARRKLVALNEVRSGGFWTSLVDAIKLNFE